MELHFLSTIHVRKEFKEREPLIIKLFNHHFKSFTLHQNLALISQMFQKFKNELEIIKMKKDFFDLCAFEEMIKCVSGFRHKSSRKAVK